MNNLFSNLRQKLTSLGDFFYYKILEKELDGMNSVLDVGCGHNSPIAKIKRKFYSVGVDFFEPSIKKSQKAKIHNEYKLGDVLKIGRYFKKKSFDAVIALDIIEHLEKEEGLSLLKQMEEIARKKIIIMTPQGFVQQHPFEKNPYQVHKSGWEIKDFKKMRYKIYGLRGFKFIRGEYATIKYKPWLLWGIIATLSQFLVYFFPSFAYQLLAVKYLGKK